MALLGKSVVSRFLKWTASRAFQLRPLSLSPCRASAAQLDLGGVYPPMPTPFNQDETIAYDKLAFNVDLWSKIPFRGLVVEGSNGEYVYLTSEERVDLVKRVREFLPHDSGKLVLAGSGCESTRDTINMSQKMADAGADAVMVVTPSYYKGAMKDKALHAHFTAVADNCPVPLILYSVPAFTVIDLSLDVIIDLAKHPNIIGIKESGGDITKIGSIIHQTKGTDFQLIAGSASFLLASLQLGGVGGVCALANVLGEAVCQLHKLTVEGDIEAAVQLQKQLIAPNSAVTKTFGISGLKKVMDWKGFYGGPTRAPLQSLPDQEVAKLHKVFVDSGYL
ncbi:4-hydroxy-2-oxoglutarate aldolase, mitochondrial-like isoform X1 [Homarus americanus]|uniref:4-hydroxy-2-oxoglutarate aldolase, mitochondrial-like isoform X1 n=1 Tax=Homarus americanus TaxID=6706 RepID=UPI001C43F471|nr:4-hydroxy-2-oxoglutarate aldolase, mitochondrial-like isoform X1 [Homarus americanus]